MERLKLGISSCLLGERVRYDGGHKLDLFLKNTFGKYFEYVPVCPEVECGLPIPREPMHLKGDPKSPRLITSKTGRDITNRMTKWAKKRVIELEKEHLCGFIFKSDSPSSGMEKVRIYNEKGIPTKKGIGIFAKIFMDHFPLIPVEDEKRIHDPSIRENFINRIFTLNRWREILDKKEGRKGIEEFQNRHHLLILSQSPKNHKLMEKLIANAKSLSLREFYKEYQTLLIESLELKTTPKKNANVLGLIWGILKKKLSREEKKELLDAIGLYRKGLLPLIVPITLINHYVQQYDLRFLKDQVYLNPHPLELHLKNHV